MTSNIEETTKAPKVVGKVLRPCIMAAATKAVNKASITRIGAGTAREENTGATDISPVARMLAKNQRIKRSPFNIAFKRNGQAPCAPS